MRPISTFCRMFLVALLWCRVAALVAQSADPCPAGDCACILRKADQASANPKTYQNALNLYFAVTACDETMGDTVEQRITRLFLRIEALRKNEEAAKSKAIKAERSAKVAKEKSDSTATAAQRAARKAYADDLAYKSTIALRDKDCTTAFRLAEFAHRYVDDDNPNVTRALCEALYYNDHPTRPPLPWIYSLPSHASPATLVVFSASGKYLATGAKDGAVKIWDVEHSKELVLLASPASEVRNLGFAADEKRLYAVNKDGAVCIWDLETGKYVANFFTAPHHKNNLVSPDGQYLATVIAEDSVKIWDLEQEKGVLALSAGKGYKINNMVFSPKGDRLLTKHSNKHWARVWDLVTSKKMLVVDVSASGSVAFSYDGKQLATETTKDTIIIWNLETGHEKWRLYSYVPNLKKIVFSPDGKYLATGYENGTLKILDLASRLEVFSWSTYTSPICSIAFSPDGKYLVVGFEDGTVKMLDLNSTPMTTVVSGYSSLSTIHCIAFSPDARYLATLAGRRDDGINIWELATGKKTQFLSETADLGSLAFSPDGKQLITGSRSGVVKIWDLSGGNMSLKLYKHTALILNAVFSHNGKYVATGDAFGGVKIWDLAAGKVKLNFSADIPNIKRNPFPVVVTPVQDLVFSTDLKRLAIKYSDRTVKVRGLGSDKEILQASFDVGLSSGLAFSPDGKYLATISTSGKDEVKIWDMESHKLISRFYAGNDSYDCVAFSQDGKRLAAGSTDGVVTIWDLERGKQILSLYGHSASIDYMVFSPDGKRLATLARDEVKIWDFTPEGWRAGPKGRTKRLPALSFQQLNAYNLSDLLSVRPENEQILQGEDVEQIIAFAQCDAQNSRNSYDLGLKVSSFARAVRLYRAALNIREDISVQRELGMLYFDWAIDILDSNRPDTVLHYLEQACLLLHDESKCAKLWFIYWEKTGQPFPMHRFLNSEASEIMGQYAALFATKAESCQKYNEKVAAFQNALRLREKQLSLDSTIALRKVVAGEYYSLGFCQLFLPNGRAAEVSIRRGMELNPGNKLLPSILAPALLLQNRWAEAEAEYRKWKDKNYVMLGQPKYKDAFLSDLQKLESEGVKHSDFEKVRKILEE